MDKTTLTLLLSTARLVADMAINWDNPDYEPPSPDELKDLANQIELLPDLPTKE